MKGTHSWEKIVENNLSVSLSLISNKNDKVKCHIWKKVNKPMSWGFGLNFVSIPYVDSTEVMYI